jgi:uncharacterized membrane protein (DUF485 family)
MSTDIYRRIKSNPHFEQLVRTRSRYAWLLSFSVLTIFYGFILAVAFNPGLMGERLAEGSMVTLGPILILAMFVLFWILTALYVRRANSEFDALNRAILSDAASGSKK